MVESTLAVWSSRDVLHTGIDLPEISAFNWGIRNFDACFPFVNHIAMSLWTDLQGERNKTQKAQSTGKVQI